MIAYLVQPGEIAPFELQSPPAGQPAETNVAGGTASAVSGKALAASSPRIDTNVVSDAGSARVVERQAISPRAKRVAAELGVDWTKLTGSGCTGRPVDG